MNILIIEDDEFLAVNIKMVFEQKLLSNRICIIKSYDEFCFELPSIDMYDIVLTDIDLGHGNKYQSGFDIIKKIRDRKSKIPIIVISSFPQISSVEEAFSMGAQDYIIKPFRLKELEIRARNWYKMYYLYLFCRGNKEDLEYNGLICNIDENEFYYKGVKIKLTRKGKYILSLFFLNKERLVCKQDLYEKIWGDRDLNKTRKLSIHIFRLKSSLSIVGIDFWIVNVHGEGYMLKAL